MFPRLPGATNVAPLSRIHRMKKVAPCALALLVVARAWSVSGQVTTSGDWPVVGHDPGGMRFSPLSQITPANVRRLVRAWTYHTGDPGTQFESTPIVIGGVMYVSTPRQRVIALNAETGAEIWTYNPEVRG